MTPRELAAAYDAALAASDERLAAKRRASAAARGEPDPDEVSRQFARSFPAAAEHYRQRAEAERNACPF